MHAGRVNGGLALAVVAGFVVTAVAGQQPARLPQPTFRSRVTVIPVDVRVVDAKGKPITGLTRSDFTIVEDGVPQQIVHFSFQTLTAIEPAGDARPEFRKALGDTLSPQNKRIFLIVLGRGRQVGPVRGVEAAMRFVKDRLLPQDQVAVLAYNRATDFTTDHGKVRETLERYWKKHEGIEAKLSHHFSGLAATYTSRAIPPNIQKEIDAVFTAPGALISRSLASTEVPDARVNAEATRRDTDRIQRAEIAAERIKSGFATPFDQSAVDEAALLDLSFDEFAQKSFDAHDDLEKLYAGIRYLRYIEGEKHLVLLTPNGLFLPALETSNNLATLANDARVAIDVVHTYGMAGAAPMTARRSGSALDNAVPSAGVIFNQRFTTNNSQQMSRLTGGTSSVFQSGDSAFTRIDESTRAQYLLGYSPSNGNWNGAYRKIEIKVGRTDARVLFRHGYIARRDVTPLKREEYLTYTRMANAANRDRPIEDLRMTLGKAAFEGTGDARRLNVDVRILPGAVTLAREGDTYVGRVEALSFCGDAKQTVVGEAWQTLAFTLTDENYQKFQRDGVSFTVQIPVSADPAYVKVILYDYAADHVGSAMTRLRK
ncbi:MAG: VWA domain-containing protein [Vicinamibacterales bacterium]